jgi:hypothetical protein
LYSSCSLRTSITGDAWLISILTRTGPGPDELHDRLDFDAHILNPEDGPPGKQAMKEHIKAYERSFVVKEMPIRGRKVTRNLDAITAAQA